MKKFMDFACKCHKNSGDIFLASVFFASFFCRDKKMKGRERKKIASSK